MLISLQFGNFPIRNGESPVAVVIDGMTLPDASIMNMSLYDIQLLEFVKGPQGTLYGKMRLPELLISPQRCCKRQ